MLLDRKNFVKSSHFKQSAKHCVQFEQGYQLKEELRLLESFEFIFHLVLKIMTVENTFQVIYKFANEGKVFFEGKIYVSM